MWYAIILIAVLIYFLVKSKSDFFKQDRETLAEYRYQLRMLLKYKGRSEEDIDFYIEAYDFFCKFTTKFDGATFVKDLYDIPNLDLDAMLHDYECLIGANRNYIFWYKAVWNYFENQRKQGKGNRPGRLIGLSVIGLVFVPYCAALTPKYYPLKK